MSITTNPGEDHDATWSPDGERIVYAKGHNLYLAKNDGTESRNLVAVTGIPYMPRWSPDGSSLRYTVVDSERNSRSIWEVSVQGTNPHPLLPGWSKPADECCGNWTRDGKYFAFLSHRDGMYNVWAIRQRKGVFQRASSEPIQLTTGPTQPVAVTPSTDGKRLFITGVQPRGELVRYDPKGRQFTPYLSGISAHGLDFSRDGKWVAYCTYPEGSLWRSRVDGSERLQLTFPPLYAAMPRWSPDGKRIAFEGTGPGSAHRIYLVPAEGGVPQQIVQEERMETDPTWAPDGGSLVFAHAAWLEGGIHGRSEIVLLGLNTRRLSPLPGAEGLFSPRWSHDGRYITAVPDGAQKLVLFDFSTRKWADLAKITPNYHSWSPDSKYVYFDSFLTREAAIYRVRISDHKLERIVNLNDIPRPEFAWPGDWTGVAPDGSLLVLREVGTQEIYALDVQLP